MTIAREHITVLCIIAKEVCMEIGIKIVGILGLMVCGIIAYYLFNEVKKEYIKQEKIEFIKDGIDKMHELQALQASFENELRIKKISQQLAQAETVIESVEHHDIFC